MWDRSRLDDMQAREKKALAENRDAAGRKLKVGDTVAYAISLGRSPAVQIATVHGFSAKNNKPQLKIDKRYSKHWSSSKEIVTVQYPDRMVILEPLWYRWVDD
jgi:hypothetical protein